MYTHVQHNDGEESQLGHGFRSEFLGTLCSIITPPLQPGLVWRAEQV